MSAFDLAAAVPVGSAPRVVVMALTISLTPPGSETIAFSYRLVDAQNNPLGRDLTVVEPVPAAMLTSIQTHLAARIQAFTGQVATLNASAGV